MIILDYLFYRLYAFCLKIKITSPAFSAIIFFAALIALNVEGIKLLIYPTASENYNVIRYYYFFIIAVLYFIYIFKDRYVKISEKYKNESSLQKKLGYSIIIIYFLLSQVLLFFTRYS